MILRARSTPAKRSEGLCWQISAGLVSTYKTYQEAPALHPIALLAPELSKTEIEFTATEAFPAPVPTVLFVYTFKVITEVAVVSARHVP